MNASACGITPMRTPLPLIVAGLTLLALPALALDPGPILDRAGDIAALETVIIARDGDVIAERAYGSYALGDPTNIKSASKTVISAMVGMAIERGILAGTDQKITDFLARDLPKDADPRIRDITIGHLLSMQAGLAPASGDNYGRWIVTRNWVRDALDRPFVDKPGGRMLYSTSSTHLLSAILTKASGKTTLQLAREWFEPLDEFVIGGWARDPQGIYLGGNQMAISARALLAFGETYRNGGLTAEGTRLLPADWVEQSWKRRTWSPQSGDFYGYGWYLRNIGRESVATPGAMAGRCSISCPVSA
jgi:CubicO group peptidase (beta-lactamase class C family)